MTRPRPCSLSWGTCSAPLPGRHFENRPEPAARPSEISDPDSEAPERPGQIASDRVPPTLEADSRELRESHEALRPRRTHIDRTRQDHATGVRDLLDAVHDPVDEAFQIAGGDQPEDAALGRPRGPFSTAAARATDARDTPINSPA